VAVTDSYMEQMVIKTIIYDKLTKIVFWK